jgi:hypothetical protein
LAGTDRGGTDAAIKLPAKAVLRNNFGTLIALSYIRRSLAQANHVLFAIDSVNQRPQSSSASRFTAGAFRILFLSQDR